MLRKVVLVSVLFMAPAVLYAFGSDKGPGFEQQMEENEMEKDFPDDGQFAGPDMPGPRKGPPPAAMEGRMKKGKAPLGKGGEDVDKLYEEGVALIKKNDPAFAKKLEENPDMYRPLLKKLVLAVKQAEIMGGDELVKNIVSSSRFELESRELAMSYKNAQGAEKEKIKKELEDKVARELDLRIAIEEHKVKMAEDKLTELKARLAKRKSAKKEIAAGRVQDLLGESVKW